MKKLLLVLLALPLIGFGQNVNIPDANFKAILVGEPTINTNGDAHIQVSEAAAFNGIIWCPSMGISNLTGIEAFTALTYLNCEGNQLTSLNVSQNIALTALDVNFNIITSLDLSNNTALTELDCADNQLTSLDVSQNTDLHFLQVGFNQLTSLDVSNNTALETLFNSSNQLTTLDVSNNTALKHLGCPFNQLTSLDVSQNTALYDLVVEGNQLASLDLRNGNNLQNNYLNAMNNPNLICIDVDDSTWATANWTVGNQNIDAQHYFSNNCSTTSIQEHTTNKELLKVTDLLGRETKGTNQLLFYIYNDGTVEKKVVLE